MVLACLVTRVGMSFLSRLSQSAPGWVLGEELIKIGIGEFVHLDSPWLRWSCRCGEVKVGSTPKPPYMAITLASADAEAAPGSWITVQTVILVWIKVQTAISTLIEIEVYDSLREEAGSQPRTALGTRRASRAPVWRGRLAGAAGPPGPAAAR